MQDKLNEWIAKVDGKPVEVEDSSALNQCMDGIFDWCNFIGIPLSAVSHPAAYQVWTSPTDDTVKYFDFIPNTPNGIPEAGDIVVFSQKVGLYGHVSVATGKGDVNSFESEDQNWNWKQTETRVKHSYDAVLGFLRPKVQNSGTTTTPIPLPIPVPTDKIRWDFGDGYGDLELGAVHSMLLAKDAKIEELVKQVGDDATEIAQLQSKPPVTISNTVTHTVYVHESLTEFFKRIFSKSA